MRNKVASILQIIPVTGILILYLVLLANSFIVLPNIFITRALSWLQIIFCVSIIWLSLLEFFRKNTKPEKLNMFKILTPTTFNIILLLFTANTFGISQSPLPSDVWTVLNVMILFSFYGALLPAFAISINNKTFNDLPHLITSSGINSPTLPVLGIILILCVNLTNSFGLQPDPLSYYSWFLIFGAYHLHSMDRLFGNS